MSEQTHYDNLQVSQIASAEVIRASYRALMQKYHPDRYADPEKGEHIAKIINDAFFVLGDPSRRASYDSMLRSRRAADVPGPAPASQEQPHESKPAKSETPTPGGRLRRAATTRVRLGTLAIGAAITVGAVIASLLDTPPNKQHQQLPAYVPKANIAVAQSAARPTTAPPEVDRDSLNGMMVQRHFTRAKYLPT